MGSPAVTIVSIPSLQIRTEIDQFGIQIYQFPECDSDEDEEFKLQDQALKVRRKKGRGHCLDGAFSSFERNRSSAVVG